MTSTPSLRSSLNKIPKRVYSLILFVFFIYGMNLIFSNLSYSGSGEFPPIPRFSSSPTQRSTTADEEDEEENSRPSSNRRSLSNQNQVAPMGGPCGYADRLGGKFECGTVVNRANTMQMTNQATMMMGQLGTAAGGQALQMQAMQSGSQTQLMNNTGDFTMATGGVNAALGAANIAMGAYLLRQASRLNNSAKELESVRNGNHLNQIIQGGGGSTSSRFNNDPEHAQEFAQQAAQQEKVVAAQAGMTGLMSMMSGFQQAGSGAAAIAQGQMMKNMAKQMNTINSNTPYFTPLNTNYGGTATQPTSPTAITGDGLSAAGATGQSTANPGPAPDLGGPINTNPIPSPPGDNLPRPNFIPSDGQNPNNSTGGGLSMGGDSTPPADPIDPNANRPMAAPQNEAGASYDSFGGVAPQGSGLKGSGDGGDGLSASALAALMGGGAKKEDPTGKTDIRFWGGGDQNLSAIPYTPYGKEADLIQRVSDRIRFEYQTGRVGN
jgi:hypothetical protein